MTSTEPTDRNEASATPNSVRRLWVAQLEGEPVALSASEQQLLVGLTDARQQWARLEVLGKRDGRRLWSRTFERSLITGVVAGASQLVVSLTSTDLLLGEGMLVAYGTDGSEHWRWAPGVQQTSAAVVEGERILVVADTHRLSEVDAETGATLSELTLPGDIGHEAPLPVGERVYLGARGPRIYAVNRDGFIQWTYRFEKDESIWLDRRPLVHNHHLYTVSSKGDVICLDAISGRPQWQVSIGSEGRRLSQPVMCKGTLVFGGEDGLYALRPADGSRLWQFATDRRVATPPLALGAVVYAACHDHRLYALNPLTGQAMWQYVADGALELGPVALSQSAENGAGLIVVDASARVTALARPMTADELASSGQWSEAASAYVDLGDRAGAAAQLAIGGAYDQAADLYHVLGDKRQAAEHYEAAGHWLRAAELWAELWRPYRQALALEQHALVLEQQAVSEEEKGDAWERAQQLFELEGEEERARACRQRTAYFRREPLIELSVNADQLVYRHWSRLELRIRNEGYGPARNLTIRAGGNQFEGELTRTQQVAILAIGRERLNQLDVRPRAYGDSVPLRLTLEYVDRQERIHQLSRTVYLTVAREPRERDTSVDLAVQMMPTAGAAQLRHVLVRRLSDEELRDLCFDLGVRYSDLRGDTRAAKARELVRFLQQRRELERLVDWLSEWRPDVNLDGIELEVRG